MLSSLTCSTGASDALGSLLSASTHSALLYAISQLQPTDAPTLKAALTRTLRAIAVAIADTVGPSLGGLQTHPSEIRDEANAALNNLFEVLCAL